MADSAGSVNLGAALKALPTNSVASKVCPHSSQMLDLDVTPHEHLPISACEQGAAVCEALAAGIMGQDKVRSV